MFMLAISGVQYTESMLLLQLTHYYSPASAPCDVFVYRSKCGAGAVTTDTQIVPRGCAE